MVTRVYHCVIAHTKQKGGQIDYFKNNTFYFTTFPEVLRKSIMFHCPDVVNRPIPEPMAGTEKSLIGSD